MVGLGESDDEILKTMNDLLIHNCKMLTIGQYLRPSRWHLPIRRYVNPEQFELYRVQGLKMGFSHVESGPLVRSSYHADVQAGQFLEG
jgi:lipoic acid synthetase